MIGRTYGSMYFLAAKVEGKNLALLSITLTVVLYYL